MRGRDAGADQLYLLLSFNAKKKVTKNRSPARASSRTKRAKGAGKDNPEYSGFTPFGFAELARIRLYKIDG